jgi:hypothetical protein
MALEHLVQTGTCLWSGLLPSGAQKEHHGYPRARVRRVPNSAAALSVAGTPTTASSRLGLVHGEERGAVGLAQPLGSRTISSYSRGEPGDVAGLAAVPVVHRGWQPQRLIALPSRTRPLSCPGAWKAAPPGIQLVLDVMAGGAVAEAAVDARLGGVPQADRLAAGLGIVEVRLHERAEYAAAAVGGSTATNDSPAAGAVASPGRVSSSENAPAVPTVWSSSKTARMWSYSTCGARSASSPSSSREP